MKIAILANSVDPDEVADNESPHLNLHCVLPGMIQVSFLYE